MMKFYMVPGSCSTGIHILLEELELLFEAHIINIPKGENKLPEYLSINPKGTIPSLLIDDGTILTEYQSIAYYLARAHPKAHLLPDNPIAEAKNLELIAYIVNTLHGQGFARIFATDNFMCHITDEQSIKDQGKEIVMNGFKIIDQALGQINPGLNNFTIADATLFYVEFWADKLKIEFPENCQKHYNKMCERPAVKRVLREEGYY